MRIVPLFFLFCANLATGIIRPASAWDITTDKVGYICSDSHLDDQWEYTRDYCYQTLIGNFIHPNFALLRSYPR